LSEIIAEPEKWLDQQTYARIDVDIDLSFEEASYLKEKLTNDYGARKIELIKSTKIIEEQEFDENAVFRTVDQMVIEGLMNFESESIKSEKLIDIYMELDG
jgi:hypothetical protein